MEKYKYQLGCEIRNGDVASARKKIMKELENKNAFNFEERILKGRLDIFAK